MPLTVNSCKQLRQFALVQGVRQALGCVSAAPPGTCCSCMLATVRLLSHAAVHAYMWQLHAAGVGAFTQRPHRQQMLPETGMCMSASCNAASCDCDLQVCSEAESVCAEQRPVLCCRQPAHYRIDGAVREASQQGEVLGPNGIQRGDILPLTWQLQKSKGGYHQQLRSTLPSTYTRPRGFNNKLLCRELLKLHWGRVWG